MHRSDYAAVVMPMQLGVCRMNLSMITKQLHGFPTGQGEVAVNSSTRNSDCSASADTDGSASSTSLNQIGVVAWDM